MAAAAYQQEHFHTPDEYLALEREAEFRSEYLDGRIYAMAGGSLDHSNIAANVTGVLFAQLLDKPCRILTSDMKVRSTPAGLYSYPDVSVVCGEPTFHDEKRDVLTNPIVIVEVLSPTTEDFDRGTKFIQYQHIAALTDYLLIAQDEARIDHYARQSDDQWLLTIAHGLDSEISLASLGCTLSLSLVYSKIAFPHESAEPI